MKRREKKYNSVEANYYITSRIYTELVKSKYCYIN